MENEDLSNLRVTRSRSSLRNLVPPYAEPERELRRLRQSLPTPEPSGTTITIPKDDTGKHPSVSEGVTGVIRGNCALTTGFTSQGILRSLQPSPGSVTGRCSIV